VIVVLSDIIRCDGSFVSQCEARIVALPKGPPVGTSLAPVEHGGREGSEGGFSLLGLRPASPTVVKVP
jgi:hypothetical protein